MITIQVCQSLPEAFMTQSRLRASGIEALIPDELTVQNDWTLINAIGGIRVQVDPSDIEMARAILTDTKEG